MCGSNCHCGIIGRVRVLNSSQNFDDTQWKNVAHSILHIHYHTQATSLFQNIGRVPVKVVVQVLNLTAPVKNLNQRHVSEGKRASCKQDA